MYALAKWELDNGSNMDRVRTQIMNGIRTWIVFRDVIGERNWECGNALGNMGMSVGTYSKECVVTFVGLQVGLNIMHHVHILHTIMKTFKISLIYNITQYMWT